MKKPDEDFPKSWPEVLPTSPTLEIANFRIFVLNEFLELRAQIFQGCRHESIFSKSKSFGLFPQNLTWISEIASKSNVDF